VIQALRGCGLLVSESPTNLLGDTLKNIKLINAQAYEAYATRKLRLNLSYFKMEPEESALVQA
jgi:hypothetical protein